MASAQSQPILPVPPSAGEGKPPWRPRVSGIAGFLCGPMAAALIAFINLRRLDERTKAAWTLALTTVACLAFGLAIAEFSDNVSTMLAKLTGNILSPFLYPLLQTRRFNEWETSHPGTAHDSAWRSPGWAILGLVAFFVIVVGAAEAVSWNDEAQNIEVRYELPEKANLRETFVFTIIVQNTADRPQMLYSLDVDTHFLDGVGIEGTNPAFEKSEPNLLAPIRSYLFERNIPPKRSLEIEWKGNAHKSGTFPLNLDVCIDTAFRCSSFTAGTITVQ
jgi:hypothetical protein